MKTQDQVAELRFLQLRMLWLVVRPLLEGYLSTKVCGRAAVRELSRFLTIDAIAIPVSPTGGPVSGLFSEGTNKLIAFSPAQEPAWRRPVAVFTPLAFDKFLEQTERDPDQHGAATVVFLSDSLPGLGPHSFPVAVSFRIVDDKYGYRARDAFARPIFFGREPEAKPHLLDRYLRFSIDLCQQWSAFLAQQRTVSIYEADFVAASPSIQTLHDMLHIMKMALLGLPPEADNTFQTDSDDCAVWYMASESDQQVLSVVAGTEPYPDRAKATVSTNPDREGSVGNPLGLAGRAFLRRTQLVSRHARSVGGEETC